MAPPGPLGGGGRHRRPAGLGPGPLQHPRGGCHLLRPGRDRGGAAGRRQLRPGRRAPRPGGSESPGAPWPWRACRGPPDKRSGPGTSSVQDVPMPFPGLADIGFLGFPLGAVIALAIFPSDVSGTGRWRMTLDGLMVTCAIGLVSWATALGAVVRAGGDSPLALVVSVAYPASDIALLVVCVLVMSRSRAHRLPLAVIAAGLALMAVGDSGFAYLVASDSYVTDSPIDLGWFFAFGLLALASLTPGATSTSPRHDLPMVAGAAMPYVVLAGSLGLVTWQIGGHQRGLDRGAGALRGPRGPGVPPAVPDRAGQPEARSRPDPAGGPAAPPGVPRPADRAGQPVAVHRPRDARTRAAPPRPAPVGDLLPGPRRLQGRQRPPGAPRG